jgi:hypothetical protein
MVVRRYLLGGVVTTLSYLRGATLVPQPSTLKIFLLVFRGIPALTSPQVTFSVRQERLQWI